MRAGSLLVRAPVFLILVVLVIPPSADGATGLAFLKTGVDARSMVLGEAVVSSVSDATASRWNPAGLARLEAPQIVLSHIESFADLRHEFAAGAQPVGPVTAGLFFDGMWTDDIQSYDASGLPTGTFGYSAYAAGVSIGMPLRWGLRLGVTGKYLEEGIGSYSATGWAVDLGGQWQPSETSPLRLGLALLNVGPSMKFISEDFDLPLTAQGGASLELPLRSLSGRLQLGAEVRQVRGEDPALLWGAEYGYGQHLTFGLGYQSGLDTRDVSVGIGLQEGAFGINWAYAPIAENLGDEHRFTVRLDL
jgi:hypothetical protein